VGAARAGPPRARRAGALPPTGAGEDPLIDAHAHLTDARFAPDLEAVLFRARDAGAEVRALLAGRTVRGQLHCYSEGPDELGAWRTIVLVPSFAGPVTYRASRALRQAARGAAALLVETDAPYLAPEGHRGQRNEPAFVAITYAAIAAERGSDVPSLVVTTERVARELFGSRWEPPGEPPGP